MIWGTPRLRKWALRLACADERIPTNLKISMASNYTRYVVDGKNPFVKEDGEVIDLKRVPNG